GLPHPGAGSLPEPPGEPATAEAAPAEPAASPLDQVTPDPRGDVTDHGQRRLEFRERMRERSLRAHSDGSRQVRSDLWQQGGRAAQRMPAAAGLPAGARAAAAPGAAPGAGGVGGLYWQQIGPRPIVVDNDPSVNPNAPNNVLFQGAGPDSGEVVDIAIDPRGTTDQTVYIVTNDGGVWKTTNGGTSWTPLTDNLPS